jgi:hypothetical protein
MEAVSHRWQWKLAIILMVALGLRVAAAVAVQGVVSRTPGRLDLIEGDAGGYWELAHRLRTGQPFELYSPPRRVMRMPGFPLLLAGLQIVAFDNHLGVRVGLAIVGTLGCGLVFLLGRLVADTEIGLWSALGGAISPAAVGFTPLFLSETAFGTALAASMWTAVVLVRCVQPGGSSSGVRVLMWGLATGLAVGVATHMRPTWLLVGPAVAVAVLVSGRLSARSAIAAVGLLAGVALLIVPWGLRNQRVSGHFVPTTLWMGASLYDGLHPGATGASDMTFIETDGVLQRFDEYSADRHYRQLAWQFARENPGRFAELTAIKLARFFSPWPNTEQFGQWWARAALSLWAIPMLALSAYGAWRHRHDHLLLCATALPLIYFAAVHSLFVGSLRYRLPAEVPLMVLAALGVRAILRTCSSTEDQPQGAPGTAGPSATSPLCL